MLFTIQDLQASLIEEGMVVLCVEARWMTVNARGDRGLFHTVQPTRRWGKRAGTFGTNLGWWPAPYWGPMRSQGHFTGIFWKNKKAPLAWGLPV